MKQFTFLFAVVLFLLVNLSANFSATAQVGPPPGYPSNNCREFYQSVIAPPASRTGPNFMVEVDGFIDEDMPYTNDASTDALIDKILAEKCNHLKSKIEQPLKAKLDQLNEADNKLNVITRMGRRVHTLDCGWRRTIISKYPMCKIDVSLVSGTRKIVDKYFVTYIGSGSLQACRKDTKALYEKSDVIGVECRDVGVFRRKFQVWAKYFINKT